MKLTNKITKNWLKKLPPNQVKDMLDDFGIRSPYKEILIVCCVENLNAFLALEQLSSKYNINISIWQYNRKLSEALDMFNLCQNYAKKK